MWRLQGAQAQSYGFLLFPCHAAGVLAPNVADIQEYCVCARTLNPLTVKSSGVCLTVRTPTVLIICVRWGKGGGVAFQ